MTCRDVTEFLMDYLDNALTPDLRRSFDRHLAVCSNCRTYLRQYEATIRATQAAFAAGEAPDTAFPEDLTAAILSTLQ